MNSTGVLGVVCSRASASSGNETDEEEGGKDIVSDDGEERMYVVWVVGKWGNRVSRPPFYKFA